MVRFNKVALPTTPDTFVARDSVTFPFITVSMLW
jgi:hypothetical protein